MCKKKYTQEQLEKSCQAHYATCKGCLCANCTEKIKEEQCLYNCSLIMQKAVKQKASSKGCIRGLSTDEIGDLCLNKEACNGCTCNTCEKQGCSEGG